jgi:hypothetical protein
MSQEPLPLWAVGQSMSDVVKVDARGRRRHVEAGNGLGLGLGDGLGDGSNWQPVKLLLGVWPCGHGMQLASVPLLCVPGGQGLQAGPDEDQLP